MLSTAASSPYVHGSRRSVDPRDTIAALEPHFGELGITRVANITGLDRIGIPVFVAMRPNSRSLAVSQGKGLTIDAAKASAIGESLESHHAEFDDLRVRIETYEQMRRRAATTDPQQLPLARRSAYAPSHPIPWAQGADVRSGEPVWVPYELVHANACLPRVPGSGCFVCSTNGLAAGNTLAEAVLHGLCEVVERDACALWQRGSREERAATQVDLGSVDDPACRDLLERFDAAGLDVLLWDVTCDTGLPTYRAIVIDRQADPVLAPIPGAFGAGCHPLPAVALARTLTEAAQSRLTIIAGARDDLTRERYRTVQAAASLSAHRALAQSWAGQVAFRSPPAVEHATVEGDLAACVEAVTAIGAQWIVVVDLSRDGLPIHVARTIVPGLEGPTESPSYRPGPRAAQR